MTAATLKGTEAPTFLDYTTSTYASVRHGRRVLSWTLTAPEGGAPPIHRNAWGWAHIEVTEQVMFKGEPLSLSATRRDGVTVWPDKNFTAAGREALKAELLPWVARSGFERLWNEMRQGRVEEGRICGRNEVERARERAADAARAARWYNDQADILALYATGECTIEALPTGAAHTTTERDARKVAMMDSGDRLHPSITTALAKLHFNGEHVGWLSESGDPIPLDDDLARYWTRPIR